MDMFPEGIFLSVGSNPEEWCLEVQRGQMTIPLKVDWTVAALQSSIMQGRPPNCTFGTQESRWDAIIVAHVALELRRRFQHGFSSIEEAERARQKFIVAYRPYGAVTFSEGHQHITWSLQCFPPPSSCQRWPVSKEITGDNYSPVACVGKDHEALGAASKAKAKGVKDGKARGEDRSAGRATADETPPSDDANLEPLGIDAWLECDGSPLFGQGSKGRRSQDRRDDCGGDNGDGDKLKGDGGACRKKPRHIKGPSVDGALDDKPAIHGQHCTKNLTTMKRRAAGKTRF